MKQKLALSCALIHKPELLVLDEPTTGVDAVSRSEFWEMLKKLKQHHITIVVSTPYMDEAMKCDRVALIQNGKLLTIDQPAEIRDSFSKKLFSVTARDKYKLIRTLRDFHRISTAYPFGDSVHVTFLEEPSLLSLTSYLQSVGINDATIRETRPGIEDRFLELMEKKEWKQ
jgi:ABC-type multidrug transport system ATPase subunit